MLILLTAISLVAAGTWVGCKMYFERTTALDLTTQVALDWNRLALDAERFTEGYRAPIAARTYGYIGLGVYEAAVPALGGRYHSLAPLLPGLKIPDASDSVQYHLPTVVNACYLTLFNNFFMTAPAPVMDNKTAINLKWEKVCQSITDFETFQKSKEFGQQVAMAVYEWSVTDSTGHQAYLHNYDAGYKPPKGERFWAPSRDFPMPPLLPHWGKVRPFFIRTGDYLAKPLPEYSLQPSSLFYAQALEIYTLNSPLSAENLWVAEYWSDDHPGLTFTPAGRWISIATQVIEQERPVAERTLETYLKVGLALSDAAVACWYSKYHYNLERPEVYISKVFNADWRPVHHSPSFPSYPSGHSMFGAAAAEVLTQLYGNNYKMEDRSHAGRKEFKSTPRQFHSFYEMAFENAFSRIPLGVHFRMDCVEGIRLGILIGKKTSMLQLEKEGLLSLKEEVESLPPE